MVRCGILACMFPAREYAMKGNRVMMKIFMPKRIKLCLCAGAICALGIIIFLIARSASESNKAELWELVYKRKRQNPDEYTIYIQEDGIYEPYLVIDGDYGGGVLLLRKHLTNETVLFKGIGLHYDEDESRERHPRYYPASDVDAYLRAIFLPKFPSALQDSILDTTLSVAKKDADVNFNRGTEPIERKVFLLSVTELNEREGSTACVEGVPLAFYKDGNPISATHKHGMDGKYWLRSTFFGQGGLIMAFFVGHKWDNPHDWVASGAPVGYEFFLRPAFCLSPDSPIEQAAFNGETVYILSQ